VLCALNMQACKNFINDRQCVAFCPLEYIYDPRTYRKVPNVNAKYSYGSICVEKCPGTGTLQLFLLSFEF